MTRSQPKVSIVIPVYNGSNFLADAIESALGQTYPNIEVIVVNDGSNDGGRTDAIARRYGERIKYVIQENKGVAGAMNTALDNVTGDFFAWLSHDDVHLPHKAERQIEYHRRIGNENASIFSDYYLINEKGEVWQEVRLDHKQLVERPSINLLRGMINGCTLLIPMHVMREFGPFDENLHYTQDYQLWNKIQECYDFFHLPEVLVKYRVHPGQDNNKPGAVIEGDALWNRMISSRTKIEQVQISGSVRRYYEDTANFLDLTPYKKAAACAHECAERANDETLVSVVIPFHNEVSLVTRAAASVLAQTHKKLELILVDDGSSETTAALKELTDRDPRVLLLRKCNSGPGAARNYGMSIASGEYIAFLDSDDLFVPHKIQRQLSAMQDGGYVASHTSYLVSFPERHCKLGTIDSGRFGGSVYPAILGGCPIATPTVMIHRILVSEGFAFPTDTPLIGEDVLAWVWLAQRHEVLGIPELLSLVEWSGTSAAINLDKSLQGLSLIIRELEKDPVHSCHGRHLHALRRIFQELLNYRLPGDGIKGVDQPRHLNEHLIASVFAACS